MFDYACIAILSLIAYNAKEWKVLSYFLLFEFVSLKLVYILCYQMTGFLEYEPLYGAYVLIQAYTISMMVRFQHLTPISILILANLGYNVLTIKQLVLSQQGVATLDYYGYYGMVCGSIMIMQLFYMWWKSQDVGNHIKLYRNSDVNRRRSVFFLRTRLDNKGAL